MQVIRDALWNVCLSDATKMNRLREPNDKCYHLADATWKMKMRYKNIEARKKEHSLIFLDAPPKVVQSQQRTQQSICCAITMSSKKCRFKAVCGKYCRKHKVVDTSIGEKTDISSLLGKLDRIKITD
jgi:hypothetical protein|tara:strand:+ start:281 stop:661 length:381 start_codon:yes stop_codon:yes gene_type:complete